MTTSEDILEHYGVPGMKWGRRGAKKSTVGSSKDYKRASAALSKSKSGGVKALSNKELSDLNKRLELEKKYSELNRSTADKGKKFMGQFLGNTLKGAVAGVATQQIAKAITAQIAKRA